MISHHAINTWTYKSWNFKDAADSQSVFHHMRRFYPALQSHDSLFFKKSLPNWSRDEKF